MVVSERRSAAGEDSDRGTRPMNKASPATSITPAAALIFHVFGDQRRTGKLSERTTDGIWLTGAKKRYPRRATVPIKRGVSALSPRASRSRRTAALRP